MKPEINEYKEAGSRSFLWRFTVTYNILGFRTTVRKRERPGAKSGKLLKSVESRTNTKLRLGCNVCFWIELQPKKNHVNRKRSKIKRDCI